MDDPDAQYRLRIRSTLCDLGHVKPYFLENQPQGGGHVWETPIDGFHMYRTHLLGTLETLCKSDKI